MMIFIFIFFINIVIININIINEWYSSSGKSNLKDDNNFKSFLNNKDNKILEEGCINTSDNLFNNYNKFINDLNIELFNLIIIMELPNGIKAFTTNFLRIVLNCTDIDFVEGNEIDEIKIKENKTLILKAYLIHILIHEINYFLKRYYNSDKEIDEFNTQKINGNSIEGGEQLIELIFNDKFIGKKIDLKTAKFILNINNWNNFFLNEFREEIAKIMKENNNEMHITSLSLEEGCFCAHSLIHQEFNEK